MIGIRQLIIGLVLTCIWTLAPLAVLAVQPDEMLADPALEARARSLSLELRCPVCQNQSIDDSNAELARDLRLLIRERLLAGDSDPQVIDYLVDRYGAFIRLNPRFGADTLILWLAPALLLGVAFAGFSTLWRKNEDAHQEPQALSNEEMAMLERALEGDERP